MAPSGKRDHFFCNIIEKLSSGSRPVSLQAVPVPGAQYGQYQGFQVGYKL